MYPVRCRLGLRGSGEDGFDWQCQPERVCRLGSLAGVPVHVVPGSGRMLDKQYASQLLNAWLPETESPRSDLISRSTVQ